MKQLQARIRKLLGSRRGRIAVAIGVGALLGLIVLARRGASSSSTAPVDPAMAGIDPTTGAPLAMVSPGAYDFTGADRELYESSFESSVHERFDMLETLIGGQGGSGGTPATSGAPKTYKDKDGNIRKVGTGELVRKAGPSTKAKTYRDKDGNIRQVGTGALVKASGTRGATFRDGDGNIRQVGSGTIVRPAGGGGGVSSGVGVKNPGPAGGIKPPTGRVQVTPKTSGRVGA